MSRRFLVVLVLFLNLPGITAAQSPPKKIYYIDSVFILKLEKGDDNVLIRDDIAEIRTISDPDTLQLLQLINIDTVVYVLTRAYLERPDSIRHIPTLKTLVSLDNQFFYKDTSTLPYSGPFLDYYLNGNLKTRGQIKEGYIEGYVNSYYKDGSMKASHYYSRTAEDGVREEYYPNGSIKKRGNVRNGYMEGLWQEWHSTGKLKSEIRYLHSSPFYAEGEDIFYGILRRIPELIESGLYKQAMQRLDDCKKANPDIEEIYYYYGLNYLGLKQPSNAIHAFTKALEIEPLYVASLKQRALANAARLKTMNEADTTGQATLRQSICDDLQLAIRLGEKKASFPFLSQFTCKETAPAVLQ
jgi:tetratricopeptide (TPR) repeat protein